jgi:hypothetical protein
MTSTMPPRRALPWLCAVLAVGVALLCAGDDGATACGGPAMADLGPIAKVGSSLDRMMEPDPVWASWGAAQREELRFLYPFKIEHPTEIDALWQFSYEQAAAPPAPSFAPVEQAMKDGDLGRAKAAASAVILAVLDEPAGVAAEHAGVLWRAVELVELAPQLGAVPIDVAQGFVLGPVPSNLPAALRDALAARASRPGKGAAALPPFGASHPLAASLGLWALGRDFAAKVPDGWSDTVRNKVPAATFQSLEAGVDRWLAAYPGHPLAPYAQLWKVRIRYFRGDTNGAWQVLLAMYPRHLPRVLGEMRYLLLQNKPPSAVQIDALTDPELITALAGTSTITETRLHRWWPLAEASPSAKWAVNLEERLLFWMAQHAKPGELPAEFPATARDPSPLWAKLRAVALGKAGQLVPASREIESVPPDPEQSELAAQIRLARGQPEIAARLPQLGADALRYLVRVRLDTQALQRLALRDDAAGKEARAELAVRLSASGLWTAAARRIAPDDPNRADLYRQAATLAARRDAGADLALARFLDANPELFRDGDPAMYRAMSGLYGTPSTPRSETQAIAAALTRGTPRWRALALYARWLPAHTGSPEAELALAEADRIYNRLTNYGGGSDLFWGRFGRPSPEAKAIRAAGKIVRAKP